jgi:pimeloyl-ACP methyl ester carboxylesterase
MKPLFYDERGGGPAIVFLHGFCESREIWKDFVQSISERFRTIALDLPGFGNSPSLDSGFTIDDVADQVAISLQDMRLYDAFIVGHSLGGYVALSLAERYPHLTKGLSLFHSTVYADSEEKQENRNKVIRFVSEHGVRAYVDTFVPGLFFDKSGPGVNETHAIAVQTSEETLISFLKAMRDRPDRFEWWKKSDLPKLLIAGREDSIVPLAASRDMSKIGRNLQYFELEKTAHMGFFEAKQDSQQIIARFTDALFFDKQDK